MKEQNNSSDSSDDDEEQMRQFMEAADPMLLTNGMFQDKSSKEDKNLEKNELISSAKPFEKLKSQRYLPEDEYDNGTDLHVSSTQQNHVYKKLAEILGQQVEFCDVTQDPKPRKDKKFKSKLKLLRDSDCYVQFKELPEEVKGPAQKPEIRKRTIPDDDEIKDGNEKLKAVVVTGSEILSGKETQTWTKKTEREDKLLKYKSDKKGVIHEVVPPNEFSSLRRNNHWDEKKIKRKLKSYLRNFFFKLKSFQGL